MMKTFGALLPAVLAALVGTAAAQGMGNGISKNTYAVSDPHAAYDFVYKYLPVGCFDGMCRSEQTCGVIGRSQLCTTTRAGAPGAYTGDCTSGGMGVHFVNSTSRPYLAAGLHALSVPELEAAFSHKFAAAVASRSPGEAFLDFTYVLYAMDMGPFLEAFTADKVAFLPLQWPAEDGGKMFSLLVQVPSTQVIFEIVTGPYDGSWAQPVEWVQDANTRVPTAAITNNNAYSAATGVLTPVAVSKATSDMAAIESYYTGILQGTRSFTDDKVEGVHVAAWTLSGAAVVIRFIERAPAATSGALTVGEWEAAKLAAHRQLRTGNVCGFNKWYDNHFAWDQFAIDMDTFAAEWDAQSWPYKIWLEPHHNVYAADPTGDTIQMDAPWSSCAGNCSLAKYNALSSNCLIGHCTQDSTADCTAVVKTLCPFSGAVTGYPAIEECMDCATLRLAEITEKGCSIADVSQWCIEQWYAASAASSSFRSPRPSSSSPVPSWAQSGRDGGGGQGGGRGGAAGAARRGEQVAQRFEQLLTPKKIGAGAAVLVAVALLLLALGKLLRCVVRDLCCKCCRRPPTAITTRKQPYVRFTAAADGASGKHGDDAAAINTLYKPLTGDSQQPAVA